VNGALDRYRDFWIVRIDYDRSQRDNEDSTASVRYLAERPPALDPSAFDETVSAPIVLLEGDREKLKTDLLYLDPPRSGQPVPFNLLLAKVGGFWTMMNSRKRFGDQRQADYAFGLLARAVDHARESEGAEYARALVKRLHEHRWTGGSAPASHLLLRSASADVDEIRRTSADERFLSERIAAVRAGLDRAKTESTTLTGWMERLYLLNPDVLELMQYLRMSETPVATKWYRFFAEVDADIAAAHFTSSLTAVSTALGDTSATTWAKSHVVAEREGRSRDEYLQRLDYLLNARTTIPKFWHDAAAGCYDADPDKLPYALDDVDSYRAISISVLEAFSIWWTTSS